MVVLGLPVGELLLQLAQLAIGGLGFPGGGGGPDRRQLLLDLVQLCPGLDPLLGRDFGSSLLQEQIRELANGFLENVSTGLYSSLRPGLDPLLASDFGSFLLQKQI